MKLDHLFALTDDNALLQHAKFSIPARREGYVVDDNARALVFATIARTLWPSKELEALQHKLMRFLLLMQSEDGRFHNLMDFSHRIVDTPSVGDYTGRAIWAAGKVINSDLSPGVRAAARFMFDRSLPWVRECIWPRTQAYACLGLCERLQADPEDNNLKIDLKKLADNLVDLYNRNRTVNWEWFESIMTYDNARFSQALLAAYQSLGDTTYLTVGEKTIQFLRMATTMDDTFVPIGSNGWYPRDGKRALYDQQPIEAGAMIEATALAYRLTRSSLYEKTLHQALDWFFGKNTKSVRIYVESTGACYDGITEVGLNENQGAESTLAFLLATAACVESGFQE